MKNFNLLIIALFFFVFLFIQGCASYTTPAGGVNLTAISTSADADIAELMAREPQANFPARIAVARLQAPEYKSRTNYSSGKGRYSVLTTRDIEEDSDFEKISQWKHVAGVAPIGRLLLQEKMDSMKDIRIAAAKLKTDLVFVYTIETSFHIEGSSVGPLSAISLGFLKNKQAHVNATTSGAIVDVRSGLIYGIAEATESEQQRTSFWDSEEAIDRSRLKAEAKSFKKFVGEAGDMWQKIVAEHAGYL